MASTLLEFEEATQVHEAESVEKTKQRLERAKKTKEKADGKGAVTPTVGPPFQVKDITMLIPRGTLVAVVGSVGRYVVRSRSSGLVF